MQTKSGGKEGGRDRLLQLLSLGQVRKDLEALLTRPPFWRRGGRGMAGLHEAETLLIHIIKVKGIGVKK